MKNPFEEKAKERRITELLKENVQLREELKQAKSEAWTQKTTAEILGRAVDIKEEEKKDLQVQLDFERAKINDALSALNTTVIIRKKVSNEKDI